MKQKLSFIAISIALTFLVSCNYKNSSDNEKTAKIEKEQILKKDCNDVHWSHHEGEDGPKNWKNLCDGFYGCGGSAQSPINIVTSNTIDGKELASPVFNYGQSKVDIINNGHTVQFNVDGKNMINLNGKEYKLLQFHYHALSEHTIDGKYFPLEVHFVHQHSDTDYAVIGIIFVEGKKNELFSKFLDKFPTTNGEYKSEDMIDLMSLLPENKSYYNYKGSLTTPPCSEVVNWYVLKNHTEASKEQIEVLSKILNNNYRPVMPLNNRKVELFNE